MENQQRSINYRQRSWKYSGEWISMSITNRKLKKYSEINLKELRRKITQLKKSRKRIQLNRHLIIQQMRKTAQGKRVSLIHRGRRAINKSGVVKKIRLWRQFKERVKALSKTYFRKRVRAKISYNNYNCKLKNLKKLKFNKNKKSWNKKMLNLIYT